MKRDELTIYQQGALTWLELKKKARRTPAFAGFLDHKVFAMSLGWCQTKKKRGYTEEQAAQFLKGFEDASKVIEL